MSNPVTIDVRDLFLLCAGAGAYLKQIKTYKVKDVAAAQGVSVKDMRLILGNMKGAHKRCDALTDKNGDLK